LDCLAQLEHLDTGLRTVLAENLEHPRESAARVHANPTRPEELE
jgi:hypothetical protein